jgi:hypothetical protein
MTSDELDNLLTRARIPWGRIEDAGYDLQDIADMAGAHGDHQLRERAVRAARRRARCVVPSPCGQYRQEVTQ